MTAAAFASASAAAAATSVKVAVRVRPFSERELKEESKRVVSMEEGRKVLLVNPNSLGSEPRAFTYDYAYSSFDPSEDNYARQDKVFDDLGSLVLESAFGGYNTCVFAYGQTGAGKTFSMMGNGRGDERGLIPRICEQLFERVTQSQIEMSCKAQVSYLEIYNERVKDLMLPPSANKSDTVAAPYTLKVREHPDNGPYVENLSRHVVEKLSDVEALMEIGNRRRTTAATLMNDVSSRSHAVFTISFTQALFEEGVPRETTSKINLVDLAGSERAEASGATGNRLREGSNINKSLTTLGLVISALAHQSLSFHKPNTEAKPIFVPYRDSVLTWLLKDSLGGNSKTIMLAAISPADICYNETLTTLRYANRAKNIVNKPTVNEDPMARLIRELRAEIFELKGKLAERSPFSEHHLQTRLHQNEALVATLTNKWEEKWSQAQHIMQTKGLSLSNAGGTIRVDTEKPYLISIDSDPLSASVTMCYLKEGVSWIGCVNDDGDESRHLDIELDGEQILACHCSIHVKGDEIFLEPEPGALCLVDSKKVEERTNLHQGSIVQLGQSRFFRLTHPAQAALMREEVVAKRRQPQQSAQEMFPRLSSPYMSDGLTLEREIDEDLNQLQKESSKVYEHRHLHRHHHEHHHHYKNNNNDDDDDDDDGDDDDDDDDDDNNSSVQIRRADDIKKIKQKIREDQKRLNMQRERLRQLQRELGGFEDSSDMSGEGEWKVLSAEGQLHDAHTTTRIKIEIEEVEQSLEADRQALQLLSSRHVHFDKEDTLGAGSTDPKIILQYDDEGANKAVVAYRDDNGSPPSSYSPQFRRKDTGGGSRVQNIKRAVLDIFRPTKNRVSLTTKNEDKYHALGDDDCNIFERNVEDVGSIGSGNSSFDVLSLELQQQQQQHEESAPEPASGLVLALENQESGGGGKDERKESRKKIVESDDDDVVRAPRPPLSWFCCYCF
ncbi:kinesin-like protein KIF16B [Oscarella lobularis]|uniref:kinesin-like protein KIF16B n=1 Tax=Oscarella lobularis TaxID=121494 RepID=UPI003313134C